MTLNDHHDILILITAISIIVDCVLIINVIYQYNHRRTIFAAAHCISPIIALFWLISILVYTEHYKGSIKSTLDFTIFMPFWIVIVYILAFLVHWKLFLLRVVISKITKHLVLMLKISFLISTVASLAQITLYVLFLCTPDKEKASTYANKVSLILVVHIIQEIWGLLLVVFAIKRYKFVYHIGSLKIAPIIPSNIYLKSRWFAAYLL